MTDIQTEAVIHEMVQRIVRKMNPLKIILFGSRARGTARPDSDVDLLVVLPLSGSKLKRQKTVELYCELGGMGLSKDIVVVTPEDVDEYRDVPGTIIQPALEEGKVLYERAG